VARTKIKDALLCVARVWQQRAEAGELSLETVTLYTQIAERLLRFAAAQGVTQLDDITADLASCFIQAPGHDRHQGIILNPAAGTRRQRRSALESLFAEARTLGLTKASPLVDLPPIPRSPRKQGTELSDSDVQLLRFHAERGMPATRHAALLALLLAGLHTAEIAAATTDDLDLTEAEIWTNGATRTRGRCCHLDEWGVHVLWLRRTHLLRNTEAGPPPRLVTAASSAYRSQASVCSGFGDIARRSGLATRDRRVEPKDVTRYVARVLLYETGQLSEVARRLGLSSLDAAAAFADHRWNADDEGGGEVA
jgi:site-specific recombinase XerC